MKKLRLNTCGVLPVEFIEFHHRLALFIVRGICEHRPNNLARIRVNDKVLSILDLIDQNVMIIAAPITTLWLAWV
ncbi:MAG: hypothetical protein P8L85_05060 [Rubripirellula sp.]|nr:hypothetical protein [Rubripirellula sp.]